MFFSCFFVLQSFVFLLPVKWSAVICQKNAKCIVIDEVEIWGGVHTTQEGSWKYERIAYPNWGERVKEIILVCLKKKWLQNKAISLWNLIHMHSIIFPEQCCSNIYISANSSERYVGYMSYYEIWACSYTKEFPVCFLLLLLLLF